MWIIILHITCCFYLSDSQIPIDSPLKLVFFVISRVDKQKNELGRWKSRIVAIFLLFLTLWHVLTYKQADATLASLSILKYGALKWPHRVIRGSKIKSTSILFKSMSDRRPWLKNSKNVIFFFKCDTWFWR